MNGSRFSSPFVPAEPSGAIISNSMVQVTAFEVFHDHDGTVWLETGTHKLHDVAVMTALQNGNLLLENV